MTALTRAFFALVAAATLARAEALFPIENVEEEEAARDTVRAEADTADAGEEPRFIVYERDPESRLSRREIEERLFVDESELNVWLEDQEGRRLALGFEAQYDRVHEFAVSATQRLEDPKRLTPQLRFREMFSTGLEHWYYRADVEQPLSRKHRVALGASAFNETTVFQDLENRVGDAENTLASLFFREDFRHYLGREGFELYASFGTSRRPELTVRYRDAQEDPLPSTTNGSVFRPRDAFRDNPAATRGRLRSVAAEIRYDSTHDRRANAAVQRHALVYEISSDDLESAFEFRRWVAESRFEYPLGPVQELRARVRVGGVVHGELPVQSLFYLGGIGSLHAQDYASIVGERMLQLNIEYAFDVFWQIRAIVFQDLGAAWNRPSRLADLHPAFDAGVALGNRTGRFRVNFARDMRADRAPLVVTVRLMRTF